MSIDAEINFAEMMVEDDADAKIRVVGGQALTSTQLGPESPVSSSHNASIPNLEGWDDPEPVHVRDGLWAIPSDWAPSRGFFKP